MQKPKPYQWIARYYDTLFSGFRAPLERAREKILDPILPRVGRRWRRHRERVEEVCWSRDEIGRALRAAGFAGLRAWNAAPFFAENPLITPGCRSVYLARMARGNRRSHA